MYCCPNVCSITKDAAIDVHDGFVFNKTSKDRIIFKIYVVNYATVGRMFTIIIIIIFCERRFMGHKALVRYFRNLKLQCNTP